MLGPSAWTGAASTPARPAPLLPSPRPMTDRPRVLPDHRDRLRQQQARPPHPVRGDRRRRIARWHRMLGDDTRFLTGTDEHSINIAQARRRRGPPDARVRRREGRAVQGGRGRPRRSRPTGSSGRPTRTTSGPPRRWSAGPTPTATSTSARTRAGTARTRASATRPTSSRDGARDDLPEPSRRPAPVADRAELVLPAVGLPGAPRAPLRRPSRLRPARLPAQRDARLHPRRARGLLDQPRADAGRLGHPVPDRRERRDRRCARTARGTPRRARSTSGTTR